MIKQKKVGSILNKFIPQGSTIGIIGGGQLGQMMALDAKQTGMKVIILDPTPNCPAGQVADEQIVAPYADTKAIEKLADKADVFTLHDQKSFTGKEFLTSGRGKNSTFHGSAYFC